METSDSEYFESADEDLQSDDEDTKTLVKNVESEQIELNRSKVDKLKLAEDQPVTNLTIENNNANVASTECEHVQKDDEKNDNTCDLNKKDSTKELEKRLDESGIEETSEVNQTKTARNINDDQKTKEHDKKTKDDADDLWNETEIAWGKDNEENMWENDEWEPFDEPQQLTRETPSPQKTEQSSQSNVSWGSWGNWGVSSIISTATQSVSTLTQGISNVLETGIGVPDPEELAKINKAEKEKIQEISPDETSSVDKNTSFGLGNLVMGMSHLTKLVETTGTKVIAGGLDTLETIGKKTMEVLQEGDPGLKKKRAFLKIDQDKPVLSQLLREAKEKAERENRILEEKHFAKKAKNYETLFDDHQGLVHLEALEMLSKQCDIKLQTVLESNSDEALIEIQETMDQVKELCELPDEDEDEQIGFPEIKNKLELAVTEINVPITYKKLLETWEETEKWLNNLKLDICDERELHQQAIETLAQLTAIAVEQFHKTGELLLVKEHRSTVDEADSLVQLTTTLTSFIGIVAAKFSEKLNTKSSNSRNKEEINSLITNVFYEAANSSSYIQDAFQLLIPVIQVGAV